MLIFKIIIKCFTWNFFGDVSRGTLRVNKCSLQEVCQVLVTFRYNIKLTNAELCEWGKGGGGGVA